MINSKLITRADLPNLSSVFGNKGNSWIQGFPSDLYIISVPKCIGHDLSITGNIGGGLDQLHSYSLPQGVWKDNDYLKVSYAGTFAVNDNDKRIQIEFGNQVVHTTGLFDVDSGSWIYDIEYHRVTSTSILAKVRVGWNFLTRDGGGTVAGNTILTGELIPIAGITDMDSNDLALRVMAEGTATDDIVQRLSVYERVRIS